MVVEEEEEEEEEEGEEEEEEFRALGNVGGSSSWSLWFFCLCFCSVRSGEEGEAKSSDALQWAASCVLYGCASAAGAIAGMLDLPAL